MKLAKNVLLASIVAIAGMLTGMAIGGTLNDNRTSPIPMGDVVVANVLGADNKGASYNGVQVESQQGSNEDRLVIKKGSIKIYVDDGDSAKDAIVNIAEESGGYVVNSSVIHVDKTDITSDNVRVGTIEIRVPSEYLDSVLKQIETEVAAKVDTETVEGHDVTEQYTDLSAQLENLRVAEEQLQDIMSKAKTTDDVMMVYNRLVQVRGEIDRLQGRIKYLQESSDMSLITVDMYLFESSQPLMIGRWDAGNTFKDAVRMLAISLRAFGDMVIWTFVYVLPIVLLALVVAKVVIYLLPRLLFILRKKMKPF